MVKPLRSFSTLYKSIFSIIAFVILSPSLWANCSVTISGPNSRCGPGVISIAAYGQKNGALPFTYQWSNGESTQLISFNLTETVTYTVTLTDANGCTATASKTVQYFPPVAPLTLTTNTQPPYCSGQVIEVTANHGGTGPFTYNWSVNHSSTTGGQSINVTLPASVSLFVRDVNNCNAFISQSFNVDNFFVTITTDSTDFVMCQGESINLKASINNQIFTISSYSWSTGETGQQIFINSGGNYSVTATATNGCVRTASKYIAPPLPLPEPVASAGVEYLCPSKTTKLNIAGSSLVKFKWSGGLDTVRTPTITQAGTYTVTVTGANTCTNTSSVTVKQGTTPPITVVGPTRLCFSAPQLLTLSVTGADNLIKYIWNTKAETPTIDVNTIGTYRVTVTNNEECTATGSITVNMEPQILASVTGVPSICVGDTVKLRVAQTFDSYAWSNSATDRETIVTEPGTYSVTVTNALGCTGIAVYSVGQKAVNYSLKNPDPICPGDTAQLRISGSTLNTYRWSTGQTTANIITTKPGTYTVTVVDNTGCGAIGRATVASRFVDTTRIRTMPYACDGKIRLQIRPDSLSRFVWSTGDSLRQITVAQDGRYSFALVSKEGCRTVDTLNVKVPALPKVAIEREGVVCANTGGNAFLNATPGFKKYRWNNGDSLATTTVTQMGTYSVQAIDALGCVVTADINIGMAPLPDLALNQSPYNCDGLRTLNADTGYTSYFWSTGDLSASISVVKNGTYALTATNSDGCTQTAEITAQIPQQDQVTISGKTNFCPGGSVDLNASNGFIGYIWSDGSQSSSLNVTKSGTYIVTATDANGCTSVAETTVNQLTKPNVVVRGATTICTGKTTTFTLQGNWSTWVWSTGETTPSINVGTAGEYTITATNNAGCSGTTSIKLIVSDTLSPIPNRLPYKCDGTITLDAGGNYANYKWSNGATTKSISVTKSGPYSVKVADFSGCSGSGTILIEVPQVLDLDIVAPIGICQGEQAMLTASPGFTTYQWSDNETSAQRSISKGGTYSLIATDANGCSRTQKIIINEWAKPNIELSAPSLVCIGSEALITAFSPNAVNYNWNNGDNTNNIKIIKGGTYSVTVKDNNGCTSQKTIDITESEIKIPEITQKNLCNGIVRLSVPNTYTAYGWSSGSNEEATEINKAGVYSITVRNVEGCEATVVTQAAIPPIPNADIVTSGISICEAKPAELNAPVGMAVYVWSNGANTSTIRVIENGTYSLTVTDADGCTASATVSVQLTDNQLPVIQCPGDIVQCNMDSRVSYDLPVAQDNCAGLELAQTEGLQSGTNYPVGTTINTWIAKDAQGNTATCSFNVEILPSATVLLESLGNDIGNAKQGFINLNVSGSNPPYKFTWTLDNEPFAAETEDLTNIGQGSYKVVVRDANDCVVGIETFVVSNTSSTDNLVNNNSLRLLPNPVSEILYVQFAQPPSAVYALILFDAKGRLVAENYSLTAQNAPLDMSQMPAGIYMLRYQAEGQTWTFKVMKQ